MLEYAYRLRKNCAENKHLVKKARKSDRYNYFTSKDRQTEKVFLAGQESESAVLAGLLPRQHGRRPLTPKFV